LENRKSLQPPAECYGKSSDMESAIEESMQKWIDRAQKSSDARDRIAVAGGISRGVFGSLPLGDVDSVDSSSDGDDYVEVQQAA